jgi:hypothetical protein
MRQVLIGAVLVIAGIAAFIEAGSHSPSYKQVCRPPSCEYRHFRGEAIPEGPETSVLESGHLSQTPYDLLRIGAWALVIIGGLLVVMGLIRYWRAQTPSPS